MSYIATICCVLFIYALFVLDREPHARTSKALWIPVLWLLIMASRPVSAWMAALGIGSVSQVDLQNEFIEGNTIDRTAYMVLLALGIVVVWTRRRRAAVLLSANIPILLLFLYCAVSTLWAAYTDVAVKRWIKAIGDVIIITLVLTDPYPKVAVKRFLTRVAFLLVPLSVLFIKYYPELGRAYHVWTWEPMYTGVTVGKNMLGVTCLVLGLSSLWRILCANRESQGRERTRHAVAHTAVLVMVVWLLWMANSITAITCFVVAGTLMIVSCSRTFTKKHFFIHLMVVGIVLSCSYLLFVGDSASVFSTLGRDPTLTGRTAIWSMVLANRDSAMMGAGFESFWIGDRLLRMWTVNNGAFLGIQSAHNGYLEVFLNLGFIGVGLLAAVLAGGYRNVIRAFRRDPDMHRLGLAYFVVALVYNFSEAGFRMVTPIWLVLMLALAMSTTPIPSFNKERVASKRRLLDNSSDAPELLPKPQFLFIKPQCSPANHQA
jgi:exopolysaccharide production protein ExoQ